ncbi:hypothetical protein K474DRAFT_1249490 [Panus rudis PR-1116 ss-1]|nr:hypothetical protein K474DRAFT_1249490 [Panus rudis PR-1116 ss-1]
MKRAPEHLNNTGCRIGLSEGKGRGVYATRVIPARTVIEISPALLFGKDEYAQHGRYTVLDHYTFNWPDGRMALALGLGSLFNHSESPNVSFSLDTETESIRYTTSREIRPDEELCIFYGHNLWFDPVDTGPSRSPAKEDEPDDGWGGLTNVQGDEEGVAAAGDQNWPLLHGDPGEIISEEQLPFSRVKTTPEEPEEEELSAVRTVDAWVVDIPDRKQIGPMLKWIRQSGLEDPSTSHLKRVRKNQATNTSTLLLSLASLTTVIPPFPENISLPEPYTTQVPKTAALTVTSLKVKTSLWPTVYAPKRKGEMEDWSKGRVKWAWEAMKVVAAKARGVKQNGELPFVAYIPVPYDAETREATQMHRAMTAYDTRVSACHPLRHAVMNLVRAVADLRASSDPETLPTTDQVANGTIASNSPDRQNGSHYLLTSLTVFLSHEPCIMCGMALLHSRVKEIFYLIPMEKTGGCGSVACVPKLEGVNHRYAISRWKIGEGGISRTGLEVDDSEDA